MELEWLTDALGNLNWWAVILAAVVAMIAGAIWYSPSLFVEPWRKEVGLSKKDMNSKDGMLEMFLGTFIFSVFGAAFLGAVLLATGTDGALGGATLGAVIGLVFTAMPFARQNLFTRKSTTLTAIQGGEVILGLAVMGLILGWAG